MSKEGHSRTLSITVKDEQSNVRSRVEELNEELQYMRDEYADLGVMIESFDASLFHDDIVVSTEDAKLRQDAVGKIDGVLSLGNVIIPAGSRVYRDYALKHDIPFEDEPAS